MSKSVYSLVLNDNVVQEIDRLAYQHGTSRSNMINQILADAVSYTTPEMRMQEVFERMQQLLLGDGLLGSAFQLQSLPSDTMVSLRSAIQYKYNPSVRYSVELYKQKDGDAIGELRVGLRTQNKALIEAVTGFYQLWNAVEQNYLSNLEASFENGKYSRKLKLSLSDETKDISGLTVGDVISHYIATYDKALKTYFAEGFTDEAIQSIEKIYQDYRKGEVTL